MNHNKNTCLISRWKLKNGLDEDLLQTLCGLAAKVEASEEGTLMYRVHLEAGSPFASKADAEDSSAQAIPLSEQKEVIFVEVYEDAEAFSRHLKGKVFNEFRNSTAHYFEPDPEKGGRPVTVTTYLDLQSGFVRAALQD